MKRGLILGIIIFTSLLGIFLLNGASQDANLRFLLYIFIIFIVEVVLIIISLIIWGRPYWIKGGIISIVLAIITFIILIPFKLEVSLFWVSYSMIVLTPGAFLIQLITHTTISTNWFLFIIAIIISIIFYFIVGSVIGWVYGKIKE